MKIVLLFCTIITFCNYGFAESLPFKEKETLSFSIEMFGMKIGNQTIAACLLPGSQTLQLISETRTAPFVSKIYKLHNKIETHISMKNLLPVYIKNQIQEGKYIKNWTVELDQMNHFGTITTVKDDKRERIILSPNTMNIPALIYYLRGKELKLNDSRSLALLNEDGDKAITVRVEKQERIRVPQGKFSTLKVVESSGGVVIWFTNDENRLPVKIECQTNAGWLKAELVGVK
ncbi:hypothetical protein COZ71_08140 [Candidatus Desantisbacteria bacterium CG_4_8_14_3_um_filter_40_12]|uniref:DUF3108 domain-containing protein n=2 Tax=unclassified Candidatus Desantisiibacteriota TaxID=3106372 RepID=A0A2M7JA52_9BACT|nr:MAG: hypothetical protein COX18_01195 [Candidatus Desantisbacteria bacterium CG23_combo_of_CG06-09_8_20_14_all_40_23]PIX16274.1 MAG: hypothetical protein COZ71_08140 [Candidatus Desantisbacteria bacterium CG_4_8_14_3_um_filter_40_12]